MTTIFNSFLGRDNLYYELTIILFSNKLTIKKRKERNDEKVVPLRLYI